MFSSPKSVVASALVLAAGAATAQVAPFQDIGRPATPSEVASWDIDVRPDFKGLPKGSGSVAQGMEIWEAKCASCHGIFGESNEIFTPLVGGTTAEDVKTGRVARLTDTGYPGRTTLMKVPTISTLWDYIHRAMPWNAPKSLKPDEVYAVTAFLLNLGNVLPDDYVLSDANIAEAQKLIPNRNGMTTDHGMWPGRTMGNGGKPDVKAVACMKDCAAEPSVASFLPDFARNAHGNLAEQNRAVGAQHGADTSVLPGGAAARARAAPVAAPSAAAEITKTLQQHLCLTCHAMENKVVGPALVDVSKKYAARPDAVDYLKGKIRAGGAGIWGPIPMPPQTLPESEAEAIAKWLAAGAKR